MCLYLEYFILDEKMVLKICFECLIFIRSSGWYKNVIN